VKGKQLAWTAAVAAAVFFVLQMGQAKGKLPTAR
jgi:hypothetical protein